jgi:DNA-binding FadR family transcriptional regulator
MSRTDDVVNGIKRMIIEGELNAGERLPPEKELAEALGVSRGPLREGIRALSTLGILYSRQGAGTYVTALDLSRLLEPLGFIVEIQGEGQVHHLHAVRRLLESEAARLAASSITAEALAESREILDEAGLVLEKTPEERDRLIELDIAFHRVIAANSGNPALSGIIEALVSRTAREQLWQGLRKVSLDQRAHHEHLAIWRAIEAGDSETARVRMAYHLFGEEEALRDLPAESA